MICAWKELLAIIPFRFRKSVDIFGNDSLQELRLRVNDPPELVLKGERKYLEGEVTQDDLNFCINTATKYSPWACATSSKGYITVQGGHRIGICGETICMEGKPAGIRNISSVCIRVARDLSGLIKRRIPDQESILIIGPPGWGKTTLLRDLARRIADGRTVSVVDERGELYPSGFRTGRRMDILTGCPKQYGIDMVLRTMGPEYIAVDEITAKEDCEALIQAANCGVKLLATAHAWGIQEFQSRVTYRPLIEAHIFSTILVLNSDKSYTLERVEI